VNGSAWFNSGLTVDGDLLTNGRVQLARADVVPRTPSVTSTIGTVSVGTDPVDVAVQGDFAFVANSSSNDVAVIDLSDHLNPRVIRTIPVSGSARSVKINGSHLYAIGEIGGSGISGVNTIDITEPGESFVLSTSTAGSARQYQDVAFVGNQGFYAYTGSNFQVNYGALTSRGLSAGTAASGDGSSGPRNAVAAAGSLLFFVTSTHISPYTVNRSGTPVSGGQVLVSTTAKLTSVAAKAGLLAVGDERSSNIHLYFASSSAIGEPIAIFAIPNSATTVRNGIEFAGDWMYVLASNGYIHAYDIHRPSSPKLAASFPTPTQPGSFTIQGRYAYVTSRNNGTMSIIDMGGIEAFVLSAGNAQIGELTVEKDGVIGNILTVGGGLQVSGLTTFKDGVNIGSTSTVALTIVGADDTTAIQVTASATTAVANFTNNAGTSSGDTWGLYTDALLVGPSITNVTGTGNYSMVITYTSGTVTGGLCIDDRGTGATCPSAEIFGASILADSTISANAFDIAEMYSVLGTPEPGDVLTLVPSTSSTVQQSGGVAYDSMVVGIASTRPGFLLGWGGGAKVALAGRVPTKISMNNGTIQVGDALVSSDVPGYAMKATRPGMVLGYALEDVSATGTAEVFVNVGYWAGVVFDAGGAIQIDDQGGVSIANDLHVGGKFFPSLKGGGMQNDWYLFVNADSPTSSYISTNADGWMSMDTYDFAERYYSPDELNPGDVVIVSDTGRTHVQRSMNEDQMLLGIVSTRPAFIAGRPATSTYPIALSGRVPTNVSNVNGAIKAGDPLAPTTIPGVVAKAIHTGPIVGLALEDFDSANVGKIEVFVNPTYWVNEQELAVPTAEASVSSQIVISQGKQGFATIVAGSKKVRIEFPSLGAYPNVQVTPRGSIGGGWWTENYSDTGFEIILSGTEDHDVVFAWRVEATTASDVMRMSDGTYATVDPVTGVPVNWTTTSTEEIILEPEPAPEPEAQPIEVPPPMIEPEPEPEPSLTLEPESEPSVTVSEPVTEENSTTTSTP
jgi:hypothetical protein